MAPKAKMAVARISGESDHWLAMQYSLSVAMDCSSSSYSFKWSFSPKPDYHMHRQLQDMLLAAGIIHANSIGNQGGDPSHPVPFQVSAPGLAPAPWRHPVQTQAEGGVSGVMGCGAVEIGGAPYSFSSHGPSAWENIALYDSGYPHAQDPVYWDYPYGGFGGGQQGLVKPDVVMPTNVQTTTVGGGYLTFGGTSAATPHLGGAMALLVSVNPAAEPRHICQALQVSAADLGVAGKDSLFGAGRVQILDAAKRIMHLVKVDDVAPHLGDTVTASVHGNAGASYVTLFGFTAGTLRLPGFTLDIVPPFFVLLGGALDGAGTASTSFPVPVDVGLVGVTVYLQSGENDLAGLTGEVLISTLESFRIRS
jgi:subtilisin family serine protease